MERGKNEHRIHSWHNHNQLISLVMCDWRCTQHEIKKDLTDDARAAVHFHFAVIVQGVVFACCLATMWQCKSCSSLQAIVCRFHQDKLNICTRVWGWHTCSSVADDLASVVTLLSSPVALKAQSADCQGSFITQLLMNGIQPLSAYLPSVAEFAMVIQRFSELLPLGPHATLTAVF